MPALIPESSTLSCDGRSSTCPICFQLTKSVEWKMGTPGLMAKEEHTR